MRQEPLRVIAGDPSKPLVIGEVEITCFVLEDETRVISRTGLLNALNTVEGGGVDRAVAIDKALIVDHPNSMGNTRARSVNLPRFLTSQWIKPFISDDLGRLLKTPLLIENSLGGGVLYGWDANILVDVCSAILDARNAGATTQRQGTIISRATTLMKGFASVGITALIDEATGFEKVRKSRALAIILERYIAKDLRPWVKTFPNEYYEEIYRLWGQENPPDIRHHPQFIGNLTNEFVYQYLAPGVLKELQKLNPVLSSGYRENKHHQLLTENHGYIKLREHLAAIIALMKASQTKEGFRHNFQVVFGGQLVLPLTEELNKT